MSSLSPVLGCRGSMLLGREPSFYSRVMSYTGKMRCQFSLEFSDLHDIFECGDALQTFAVVKVTNDKHPDGTSSWALLGRTRHNQGGTSPQFHKTEFEISEVVSNTGTILIEVYALHPANKMPVCVGWSNIQLKSIMETRDNIIIRQLHCGFDECGTVVIFLKTKMETGESQLSLDNDPEYCSIADILPHTKMSRRDDDFKTTICKDILGTVIRQRYHLNLRPPFTCSLHLCEEMYEIGTSFTIPPLYLRSLIVRQERNRAVLDAMCKDFGREVAQEQLLSVHGRMNFYKLELQELAKSSKCGFKKSEWKTHKECKWAPVNLHATSFEVDTVESSTQQSVSRVVYSLCSVGAMAAHWEKFRNGGLTSLLSSKTAEGAMFAQRERLYRELQKVEHLLDNCDKFTPKGIAAKILDISKVPSVKDALNDLQKRLSREKQLEIINWMADLERIMVKVAITSHGDPLSVCQECCQHLERAALWKIACLECEGEESFLSSLVRYEACFSQLVSAAVAGFISALCFRYNEREFGNQLRSGVVPFLFESLLSTHGEGGMVEDMYYVMGYLRDVTIRVERSEGEEGVSIARVTGPPFDLTVTLSLPAILADRLPVAIGTIGKEVKLLPLFFSHGVNEQQTIAYKMMETSLQDMICEEFLVSLKDYINRYFLPHNPGDPQGIEALEEKMKKLQSLFKVTKRNKCPEFIVLAEQIGRDIGCIRFTSCKSGKDRTSMSLTYEYCDILCQKHNFERGDIDPVLEQFRRDGTRYYNTYKNIGSYKYCFNKLQCKMLPTIYRPPPGTFGDGALQS